MKISKKNSVFVTKSFLPPKNKYKKYIDQIWNNNQLTNQGPLLKELELNLKKYLNVKHFHFVTNGTLALQISLKALNILDGEIITTPFSYVATTSSILWERCKPVFVDIDAATLCIDVKKIEKAITINTKAILAVHVFGFPCDVEAISEIAKKHNLKIIYDGAHAFGVKYKSKSLLNYGDISVCSFHATKLFHTIEGGCIITKNKNTHEKLELIKRFGHIGDNHQCIGTNAKASEFQAAMGLCNIEFIDINIKSRKKITNLYNKYLDIKIQRPKITKGLQYNYSYYPVIFKNESNVLKVIKALNEKNIFPRRYFYPSLNTLVYLKEYQSCPISEDISSRILCLPMYIGLKKEIVIYICKIINNINS